MRETIDNEDYTAAMIAVLRMLPCEEETLAPPLRRQLAKLRKSGLATKEGPVWVQTFVGKNGLAAGIL